VKFSFIVGERERHEVDFSWSQMTGALRISVDGVRIVAKALTLSSPTNLIRPLDTAPSERWKIGSLEVQLVERWAFSVGTQERHDVLIEKERAKAFAALRPQRYRVYVDEVLAQEHEVY